MYLHSVTVTIKRIRLLHVCIIVGSYSVPSNQSFYKQFTSYGKGVGHHKVGQ